MHVVAGWLFVGSHSGDSQLLAAPAALRDDWAAGAPLSDAALRWQLVEPHAIDNLAPVQDQLVVEHPAGASRPNCCATAKDLSQPGPPSAATVRRRCVLMLGETPHEPASYSCVSPLPCRCRL